MIVQRPKVGIAAHVAEIAEPGLDGIDEQRCAALGFMQSALHAGSVVEHDRVVGTVLEML